MAEPVSLAELKAHLRVMDDTSEDVLIASLGRSAREWVESYTGLALVPKTVTQKWLPGQPLNAWPISATPALSVGYTDYNGTDQTVSSPRLVKVSRPAYLLPAVSSVWPATEFFSVSFAAGYASPTDVPDSLKAAILLLAATLNLLREDAVIGLSYTPTHTVANLCNPFRLGLAG